MQEVMLLDQEGNTLSELNYSPERRIYQIKEIF